MPSTEPSDPIFEPPATDANAVVLVVDLDETLSKTDTLHEALLRLLVTKPASLVACAKTLSSGKAAFKRSVADQFVVAGHELPINQNVLDLINEARDQGREVVLASASDQRQVDAIADHLGVFSAAFGTKSDESDAVNLSGQAKADFLVQTYGEGGFDYVGDCATDLPVWAVARTAYSTKISNSLNAQAAAQNTVLTKVPGEAVSALKPYVKALRPHQWVKNILVFLPMLSAHELGHFLTVLLAFVLFSMAASSVYIFNDLVDLPSDRMHPRKSRRPFASGSIPISHGLLLGTALVLSSIVVSYLWMSAQFFGVLMFYLVLTSLYSFYLKRKLLVDIITLAGLYTLRIIAGGLAVGIVPSPWLLAFSMFLFFSLAATKRLAELVDQSLNDKDASPGRGYLTDDRSVISSISITSGQGAVLVFALYIYSPSVADLYAAPHILWLICPILLYWLSRIAVLTHRGFMDDDPIVFAVKDKISLVTAVLVAIVVFWAERGI